MKVIAIIDRPENCEDCPFVNPYNFCDLLDEYAFPNEWVDDAPYYSLKEKGSCPLKPVHAIKSGGHDYIIYERQYLYKNLEREFDLLTKAREFDESNSTDR